LKQNLVIDNLKLHGFKPAICDRMIDGGACGLEKPDCFFDCGTFGIILEIDEHQHRNRDCLCEQTRMVNVSQSIGMPVIFLRFNPDEYKVKNGYVKESMSDRLETLREWIKYYQNQPSLPYFLSVKYLFFNDYDKTDGSLTCILPNL
jgi:hypothetical protein